METLKDLLKISPKGADLNAHFEKIARELMGYYVIRKGKGKDNNAIEYAIVEIEFYYYSKDHQDYITYPRNMEAGRWFFHQSGVDLTFQSNNVNDNNKFLIKDDSSFGGILIRGIRKLNCNDIDKEYIFGPIKCVNTLWDKFDAFSLSANEYPILVKRKDAFNCNLDKYKRHIKITETTKQESSIKYWSQRLGLSIEDEVIKEYRKDLFENSDKYRYRFFNLEQDPTTFDKIPYGIRPKGTKHIE